MYSPDEMEDFVGQVLKQIMYILCIIYYPVQDAAIYLPILVFYKKSR